MTETKSAQTSTDTLEEDSRQAAKASGLRYVTDASAGIGRKRAGTGFSYTGLDCKPIKDKDELARIKALAIPPAWTDVWICPSPRGHIQATGRDDKGRKQYKYHPKWRETRDETKYEKMIEFGLALPAIRERTSHDLSKRGMPREKVLAAIVQLLDMTLIRVGNSEYAKTNDSFGLTTMRKRHVDVKGSEIRFQFQGKSGRGHDIDIQDRRLATIVKRSLDMPGYELFKYVDENGDQQDIESSHVNEYLREISGQDFTAKDFRTWAGTLLAAQALQEFEEFDSEAAAKKNIVQAIETVAKRLGNTPAICRKCYVHPVVLSTYMEGELVENLREAVEQELAESLGDLEPEEAAVLALLRTRLAQESA
ncbi:MAG: DNA topoisomerase IB [Chloroflexia bacterium]|nr:DNA topoisomerase IB [Chloroflexia bacterium]